MSNASAAICARMVYVPVPMSLAAAAASPSEPLQPPVVMLGQTLGTPAVPSGCAPPQDPIGQVVGQVSVPPQPSPIVPQYWPPPAGVQVIFLQLGSPQTLATPWPAHVAGAGQVPQSSDPPQPSPMVPQ